MQETSSGAITHDWVMHGWVPLAFLHLACPEKMLTICENNHPSLTYYCCDKMGVFHPGGGAIVKILIGMLVSFFWV